MAPATQYQYTNPVNGYAQPLSYSQYWAGHQAQPQLANQGSAVGEPFCGYYNAPPNTPFVNQSMMGAPTMLPAPSSSKHSFPFKTSQDRILTDNEQCRSATATVESTGATLLPARFTR